MYFAIKMAPGVFEGILHSQPFEKKKRGGLKSLKIAFLTIFEKFLWSVEITETLHGLAKRHGLVVFCHIIDAAVVQIQA